jgi:hypothetical protein
MSAKEPKREVTILDDREILTYPKLNVPVKQHVVTYQADPYPARVLFIPSSEYSSDALAKAIKADLAELERAKPKTMVI